MQAEDSVVRRLLSCRILHVALMIVVAVSTAGRPLQAQSKPKSPQLATPANAPKAGAGNPELSRADLEAFLDGFVPYALKNGDIAGAVVVVVKDGEVLLKKGYGYANVQEKRAMDPDVTLVRPGSTSKLFTWTAVMQLVEAGKLDLDRDINDYLDFRIRSNFPKPITLRNLMTHRAGFEEGLKTILVYDPKQLISTEDYLKHHERPVMFPPGEIPAYSNYGAALAGYIVQRVSGEPFESYVERHIFAPLGMTHSTFRQPVPEGFKADLAQGYMTASDAPQPFEMVTTAPAGSLSATAADMAKFMIAYLQGGHYQENQILKPETVRLMFEPAVRQIDDVNTMALGFFEENRNGRRIRGHGGDTIVFHTDLDLFVDDGVGIFFSFNSAGKDHAVYGVREGLSEAFADRYFPARAEAPQSSAPAAAVSKEHAQLIAGRYESSRKVDSAFIRVFYLLNQTVISANGDGSITIPAFLSNKPTRYREIAPFVWREDGGQNRVALVGQGKNRIVFTSDDPSSALQPVPVWKSSVLNLSLLLGALAILLAVVILWPISAFARWKYDQPARASGRELLVIRVLRVAALVDLVYLAGWVAVLAPLLNNHLEYYNDSFDLWIRLAQMSGLLVVAAAGAGIWVALQRCGTWSAICWRFVNAAALVAIVWFAVIAKLIGFNLNY